MTGILVVTHGNFGKALIESAEMIIGKQPNVEALGLMPGMDPIDFRKAILDTLKILPKKTIILSDLFGGTPSNVSASISMEYDIECISGVNMAILIEACTMRDVLDGECLIEDIINAGKDGFKDIKKELSILENVI